jgi:hypothetical protein
MQQE